MKAAIVFAQFGPYHHARVKALQAVADFPVIPAQIASGTATYAWNDSSDGCDGLQTLCQGTKEALGFWAVFRAARGFFRSESIVRVFLPSYSPQQEFAVYLAAKSLGLVTILMSESHEATAQARRWKKWIKSRIVSTFDAALVGGAPQKRYYTALGIAEPRIFTGYDAIDNDYFATRAAEARANAKAERTRLKLPPRYFLNLGRFVAKKNLSMLLQAYADFSTQAKEPVALVMVGDGEERATLEQQARQLGLNVHRLDDESTSTVSPAAWGRGDVVFYGFRQIEENPSFYALADAFVLPSLREEWGLVVNEAMACGVPVIVSNTVGCSEDLVVEGRNGHTFDPSESAALAEHLAAIASQPTLRHSMGAASAEMIARWGCDHFARQAIAAAESASSHRPTR